MNKLKTLQEILDIFDKTVAEYPESRAYESDRFIQGVRYLLKQPNELTEDVIKPTTSEVKQIVNDALLLHMKFYHGGYEGGGRF